MADSVTTDFYFMAGLLFAWLGLGTPVQIIGEVYLMSAHMITTMVLTMITPPLLIMGLPAWVFGRTERGCRGSF